MSTIKGLNKGKKKRGPKPKQVDFAAAIPGNTTKQAKSLKKKRKQAKQASSKSVPSIDIYNKGILDEIYIEELYQLLLKNNPEAISLRDHGKPLSPKELKYIELYLSGEVSQEKALRLAGYQGYSDKTLKVLGKKIIEKYEALGQGAVKVLRAIGLGELKVAMLLKDLALNAKSEIVRADVTKFVAGCLGFSKGEEVSAAFNIVFNPPGPGADQEKKEDAAPVVVQTVKPLQITR